MSLLKHGTWYYIKKQHIDLIQIFQNFGDNVRLKEHTSTPPPPSIENSIIAESLITQKGFSEMR